MKHLIWYLPFIVQTLVIGFDEFYFHVKRGLPRWERIGHPLDTLSVILCLSFVLLVPYSKQALLIFLGLAILSCLLVTKDEFVHKEHCSGQEQWLHALLFINHPLFLIALGWLWSHAANYHFFITIQLSMVSLFCLYQVIFWNIVWKEKKHDQQ